MTTAEAVVAAAVAGGRSTLNEAEAYRLAAVLGLDVPAHVVVPEGGGPPSLETLSGEAVVVKVLSAVITHKSDRGGVQVVPRHPEAVAAAFAGMRQAFAGEPTDWLVAEVVEHELGPGGELLVAVRRTPDFGPVVVLGLGGLDVDLWSTALPPLVVGADASPADRAAALAASPVARLLTEGRRGHPAAIDRQVLAAFVDGLCERAGRLPAEVAEFEANPVVQRDGRFVALDALARLAPLSAPGPPRPPASLDRLLHPRSMAIVGVSGRANPGRLILENVLGAGFPAAAVTVVKPGTEEIAGCRCVPDLASLPGRVDLLVLSIGAAAAPGMLEEVVARGAAEGAILIPGGLGERAGSEALARRAEAAVAEGRRRGNGPVVNGGNSMGIVSVPGRYDATFIPAYKTSRKPGAAVAPLAVVSQSGAFAIARLDRLTRLQPRYLVTVGNQLDLTVGDYVSFWRDDPSVQVIACYLEGFRPGDGALFLDAAAAVRRRGGIVLLYLGGRTEAGAAAASSHTASVAPDHRVAAALAAEAGVLVSRDLEEFEDLVRVAVLLGDRRPVGRGLGAVSNAGFECVALADQEGPFRFVPFGEKTAGRVGAVLSRLRLAGLVAVRNPLDLTPMTDAAGFAEAAASVLEDPAVEAGIVGCVPLTPVLATLEKGAGHGEDLAAPGGLAGLLARLWASTSKPWVMVVDGGPRYDAFAGHLEEAGLPVFRTADRALRALARLAVAAG